jgi:hypothetical protein
VIEELKTGVVVGLTVVSACMFMASCGGHSGQSRSEIGDGYAIVAANSFDVGVVSPDGFFVVCPRNFANVGPVAKYAATTRSIMTMNFGAKKRNFFPGDAFVEVDRSRRLFFVIIKGSNQVTGPMEEAEFLATVGTAGLDSLEWRSPWKTAVVQAGSVPGRKGGALAAPVAFVVGLAMRFCWALPAVLIALPLVVGCLLRMHRRRAPGANPRLPASH